MIPEEMPLAVDPHVEADQHDLSCPHEKRKIDRLKTRVRPVIDMRSGKVEGVAVVALNEV